MISGDPAIRTKRTEYLVTMNGTSVVSQTLWIEIYCMRYSFSVLCSHDLSGRR